MDRAAALNPRPGGAGAPATAGGHADAEAALERALAMRAALGITRIADLTGLDRAGIPVAQAVQPFSLSMAVSQGKGFTPAQAVVSAVMECAETFCAERRELFATLRATAGALGVPAGRFDRLTTATAWRDVETDWVVAEDVIGGGAVPVPFDLVHTAYLAPSAGEEPLFTGSTTGLAAGFCADAATRHALLECIERDALARAHATHGFLQRHRLDVATARGNELRGLLDLLAQKDFLVGLWRMPSPTGPPAVWCHLLENRDSETSLLPYPAEGSAARGDIEAAACAAILEAAQSRLAAISGAREDMTRARYPKYPDRQHIAAHRRLIAEAPAPVRFDNAGSVKDSVVDLATGLARAGADTVCRIAIDTSAVAGLHVVRVVVPFLQPFLET